MNRWGFWGFNPGGESNAVCVTGHFQTGNGAIGVSLPLTGPITTRFQPLLVVMRSQIFKCQLSTHRFCLFGAFKRTALNHPAAFIFFSAVCFGGLGLFGDRRGLLCFGCCAVVCAGVCNRS